MRVAVDGWLQRESDSDPHLVAYPSRRSFSLFTPTPLGLIWHWTAGIPRVGFADELARSIVTFDPSTDRAASWHVLIAKDGALYQSVPCNQGAWHVGKPGVITGKKWPNVNRVTLGCEIENAGDLKMIGGAPYAWPYYVGGSLTRGPNPRLKIEGPTTTVADVVYDSFTLAQEASARALIVTLRARYGWLRDAFALAHRDFDAPRKRDPGPIWMDTILPRLLDEVFGAPSTPSAPIAPSTRGTNP